MDSKNIISPSRIKHRKGHMMKKISLPGIKRVNTQKARLYGMREWIAGYSLKQ